MKLILCLIFLLSASFALAQEQESYVCEFCKATFTELDKVNLDKAQEIFDSFLFNYCRRSYSPESCYSIVASQGPTFFESLFHHYFDPSFICGVLRACPEISNLDTESYINEIPS